MKKTSATNSSLKSNHQMILLPWEKKYQHSITKFLKANNTKEVVNKEKDSPLKDISNTYQILNYNQKLSAERLLEYEYANT